VVPPPPPPPSFLDELLASPLLMPGLAAIVIALGGYGWYTVRRRRKDAEEQDEGLIAADEFTANSLFGTTGGQSVDTAGPSVFGPTVRDTGVDVHPTEVDPIAEAEVYIAYGREAQAEEILREALRRQPDRQPIRMKLLEILAGRKDAASFGAVAGEMFEMTGGVNEEWPRVASLGMAIDPGNPLYEGGAEMLAAAGPDPIASDDAYDSFRQSVGADDFPAVPDPSMPLGVSPPAGGEPDGQRREFAETRDMTDGEPPDTGAPLDFGLSVDTSIGRPEDVDGTRFDKPKSDDGQSELERAVEGRFELPTLDFVGGGAESGDKPPSESRAPAGASGEAGDDARSKRNAPAEEPSALGDFGEFRVDLPDLDLPSTPRAEAGRSGNGAGSDSGNDVGTLDLSAFDSEPGGADSPQWQEMATKLDLASAYEEIGDKDGARELLEEVVRDGDADQKRKARAMLDRLA
jgi:pilus assembly protein FimV